MAKLTLRASNSPRTRTAKC